MGYNVLYFSRSGVSKRVAEKISKGLDTKVIEIKDDKNWDGPWGFIKGGFYASTNKRVNIKVDGQIDESNEYLIVSPLWAGGPAPAIRTYLKEIPSNKVKLVITCDGSNVEKSIQKYEEKNGKFQEAYGIVKNRNNENEIVARIIASSK